MSKEAVQETPAAAPGQIRPVAMDGRQWIAVDEQHPPTKEPVVYARPNGPGRWHVGIAYWTVSKRWNPEKESTFAPGGFTHWKPLGEPPK